MVCHSNLQSLTLLDLVISSTTRNLGSQSWRISSSASMLILIKSHVSIERESLTPAYTHASTSSSLLVLKQHSSNLQATRWSHWTSSLWSACLHTSTWFLSLQRPTLSLKTKWLRLSEEYFTRCNINVRSLTTLLRIRLRYSLLRLTRMTTLKQSKRTLKSS